MNNNTYTIIGPKGEVCQSGWGDWPPLLDGQQLIEQGANLDDYWDGSAFVPKGECPSPWHLFDWTTKQWVPATNYEDARTADYRRAQRDYLKAERDKARYGGFDIPGIGRFQSDDKSKTEIMGAQQGAALTIAAGLPFSLDWILEDNTVVTLTFEQLNEVGVALLAHIQAQFTHFNTRCEQLANAVTQEEIEAVVW